MLQNIPTHVIGGPLGAGKTSLIKHLLEQKPANERWAVLINEFGQVGLDAALLTTGADGIALGEVAGGCLCCVNGVPFQIGLGRLLRKARPDRLLIEPSGLGHPAQLMAQLRLAPWLGVLEVQPAVLVLDAAALAAGQPLPGVQQQALPEAGLLVMNKSGDLDPDARRALATQYGGHSLLWTDFGRAPFFELPGFSAVPAVDNSAVDNRRVDNLLAVPASVLSLPMNWVNHEEPLCFSQSAAAGWSVGWRWHPSQRFDILRLQRWLLSLGWRRAKMIVHGADGWVSGNAVRDEGLAWQPSEWRQDSRLELIFTEPRDIAQLQTQLAGCRL